MKTNLSTITLALLLSVSIGSCSDDEPGKENPVQDHVPDQELYDVPPLPEKDTETVKMEQRLYYVSEADVADDDQSLADNFLSRFNGLMKWDGASVLSQGDFLFFKAEEAPMLAEEVLVKCYEAGVIFVMEGGDASQYNDLCTRVGGFNPYSAKAANVDNGNTIHPLWVLSGSLPGASGLAMLLSPYDDEGELIDDYSQGNLIDMALTEIKEDVMVGSRSGMPMPSRAGGSLEGDVNRLIAATKFYLYRTQTIASSDYRNSGKRPRGASNSYQVEFDLWNVYSINEKRNYYYVHEEVNCSFKNTYVGMYSYSVYGIAKVSEWYGQSVSVGFVPVSKELGATIHRSSPNSTQSAVNYTSGFSWSLSGSAALKVGEKGAEGDFGFSAGATFSSSESYRVEDVTVRDLGDYESASWAFDLRDVRSNFYFFAIAMTDLHEGSLTGRTKLQAGTDFIISFKESNSAPKVKATFGVNLRSSCSKVGTVCYVRNKYVEVSDTLVLPFIKASDIEQKRDKK